MLQTLRSDNLVLSSGNSCVVASRVAVTEDLNLSGDQEEADTNIILHCANVLHRNYGENVRIWFPSGDTDIVVLAVGLLQEFNDQGFILNRSGSNKEHYKLSDFEIAIESTIAPLDLHATMCSCFSGNKNKNVGS